MSNITWNLNTGENNISSQYNISLQTNETISIFTHYNYSSSGNYTVTASTEVGELQDSETIYIEVLS